MTGRLLAQFSGDDRSLVVAGFLLLGAALRLDARLLSTPVLTGYLAGSAVVIGTSQLGKIFAIPTPGDQWWQKLAEAAGADGVEVLESRRLGEAWTPGLDGEAVEADGVRAGRAGGVCPGRSWPRPAGSPSGWRSRAARVPHSRHRADTTR